MSEALNDEHKDEVAQLPPKRPYQEPELRRLGSAADMTSVGSTGGLQDGPYTGS